MYNILVVDDEKLMRTYLANNIPVFTDKYQVSGIAKDGREAMELLKKQHYDVVITDIQMPEIDGLCLAKYIHENLQDTVVIIISGYNDFEYAQKAIHYQVTDYLLKPLVDQALKELLENIAVRLKKQAPPAFLLEKESSSDTGLKKQLLSAILEENTNLIYELYPKLQEGSLSLMNHCGCLLKCTIDELYLILKNNSPLDVTTNHLNLNELISRICEAHGYITLYSRHGATFILISGETESSLLENADLLYQEISDQAGINLLPGLTAICGKPVTDIMDLPLSMQSIYDITPIALLENRYPIHFHLSGTYESYLNIIHKSSEDIFTDYLMNSMEHLYVDIKNFCSQFLGERNLSSILRCGSYLIQYITERANVTPDFIRKAYNELTRQSDAYLPLGIPEESAAVQVILCAVSALFARDSGTSVPESMQIVTNAKEYILSHYQDNISLSDTAEYCGVSTSYLSDLFHKKLKEPYSKYLMRIRMEQAARLLRQNPDIRIYSVAEQTGFVSVKHFNTVFKKYYGTTPTNYK